MPFEKIHFKNRNTLGFEAVGKITQEDYLNTLLPIFEKARRDGSKIQLMVRFGPKFKGYTFEALWEDSKFGLRYLRTLGKVAVVSDHQWIRRLSHFFGSLLPCPVKVFNCCQTESAKAWLEFGKAGLTYSLDEENGVLTVKLSSALASEDFDVMSNVVDSHIERNARLSGLVICAEEFPGWQNFGSVLSHFDFIKNHHEKIERVALVSNWIIAKKAPLLAEHFVNAQIKHFSPDQLDRAQKWARGQEVYDFQDWEASGDQAPLS